MVASLCVCRSWFQVLNPLRWHTISFEYCDIPYDDVQGPDFLGPNFQDLQRYSSLIRTFKISADTLQDFTASMYRPEFPISWTRDAWGKGNMRNKDEWEKWLESSREWREDQVQKRMDFELTCPNLVKLELDQDSSTDGDHDQDDFSRGLVPLLWRHRRTVKDLSLSYFTTHDPAYRDDAIFDILKEYRQLERLKLGHWPVGSVKSWADRYDTLWSRLTILEIGLITYHDPNQTPQEDMILEEAEATLTWFTTCENQSRLQVLELRTPSPYQCKTRTRLQLLWILKSPDLIRLIWQTCRGMDITQKPMAILSKAIRSGDWTRPQQQQLQSLGLGESDYRLEDFQYLLKALTGLKELDLHKTDFDAMSWTMMKEQVPQLLTNLTVLDLGKCLRMDGASVHDILCSMPCLQVFEAGHVTEMNLQQDPRSWVCDGLRELSVAMVRTCSSNGNYSGAEEAAVETPSKLLIQLSKLTRLELLDLRNRRLYRDEGLLPIELTLSKGRKVGDGVGRGLDLLRSLRRLRILTAPSVEVSDPRRITWTELEARWCLTHWPHLETLSFIDLEGEESLGLLKKFFQYESS